MNSFYVPMFSQETTDRHEEAMVIYVSSFPLKLDLQNT